MFGGWGAGRGAHTGGHRPAGRLGASQYRETQALASSLLRNPAAWRAGGVPANRALWCGLSLSLARDLTPQGHSCREVRQDRPPGARWRARRGPCPSAPGRQPTLRTQALPARPARPRGFRTGSSWDLQLFVSLLPSAARPFRIPGLATLRLECVCARAWVWGGHTCMCVLTRACVHVCASVTVHV